MVTEEERDSYIQTNIALNKAWKKYPVAMKTAREYNLVAMFETYAKYYHNERKNNEQFSTAEENK